MKIQNLLPILFIAAILTLRGQDIRDKVSDISDVRTEPDLISPGKSLLGFKVGTKEDDIFKILGKPQGYIRLNLNHTAAIYEHGRAFIFTDDLLSGVRIGYQLIDFQMLKEFGGKSSFQVNKWSLANGINSFMNLEEVEAILGDKLKQANEDSQNYYKKYEEGDSVVHLYFSSQVGKQGKSSFSLNGILVMKKD